MIVAIRAEIPEYRRPLTGEFGRSVRQGVHEALSRFVDLLERREHDALGPSRAIYYRLGRAECREGRSLDALLGAYRIGALVAWRDIVPTCTAAAVEPSSLYVLAEAIFAYIHELSAVSAEGYSQERSAAAGAAQAARQELVELLTVRHPSDGRVREAAAERAGWSAPASVAALVTRASEPERLAARIGPGAIGARIAGFVCVLAADPEGPGREQQLAVALCGADAALGPAVSPSDAPQSWQRGRRTLELMESGLIPGRGVVRADAHLGTILLHENEDVARELASRWLAPLEDLSQRSRQGLPETLLAWLAHHGDVRCAGRDLHVHPQTVRYRLRKLRELYGDALDDADARFELGLALRAAGTRSITSLDARRPGPDGVVNGGPRQLSATASRR